MTVDREPRAEDGAAVTGGEAVAGRPEPLGEGGAASGASPVSRATVFWYSAVGAILFSWFLFGWLVLKQGFVDSVGEALGTGFTLLLAVSIVGTVRRSRMVSRRVRRCGDS